MSRAGVYPIAPRSKGRLSVLPSNIRLGLKVDGSAKRATLQFFSLSYDHKSFVVLADSNVLQVIGD
jgi:hypothetical protein